MKVMANALKIGDEIRYAGKVAHVVSAFTEENDMGGGFYETHLELAFGDDGYASATVEPSRLFSLIEC